MSQPGERGDDGEEAGCRPPVDPPETETQAGLSRRERESAPDDPGLLKPFVPCSEQSRGLCAALDCSGGHQGRGAPGVVSTFVSHFLNGMKGKVLVM